MAETPGSKGGAGTYLSFETISTTAAISEGSIIELDSSGYAQACATDQSVKVVGIAATGKKASDSARRERISVQASGKVTLYGWDDSTSGHQTSIVPGERVMVGTDSDNSYTGQVVVHATTAAGTTSDFDTDLRKPIGIALQPISTAGTRYPIEVLLTL